jgi:hypothetical protein
VSTRCALSQSQSGCLSGVVTPAFTRSLLEQSVTLLLRNEPEAARAILHDVVRATIGFGELAKVTNRSVSNLRGMLRFEGRVSMDSLAAIYQAISQWLDVSVDVRVAAPRRSRRPRAISVHQGGTLE